MESLEVGGKAREEIGKGWASPYSQKSPWMWGSWSCEKKSHYIYQLRSVGKLLCVELHAPKTERESLGGASFISGNFLFPS